MEGLNKIFCGSDVRNTGICECFFDPKLIIGAIYTPKNKVFTADELSDANIADTLTDATMAPEGERIYPFQPFEAITDNTEDPTRQTFGYGTVKTVREGKYNWAFQFIQGGLNLSNALRTFNGLIGKFNVIFIESGNTLIATSRKDVNGEWGLAGVPMSDIYTRPWRPSDGTNVTNYTTEFSFDPVYINEAIAFKRVGTDAYILNQLAGLEDIKLTIISVAGSTANVTAETDCGSTDMYDLYKTELSGLTAWKAFTAAGAVKTISTVTANDTTKSWALASSTPFADGDTVELSAPTVLANPPINIVGYESVKATVDLGS